MLLECMNLIVRQLTVEANRLEHFALLLVLKLNEPVLEQDCLLVFIFGTSCFGLTVRKTCNFNLFLSLKFKNFFVAI